MEVTIYTKTGCPYCAAARQYLNEQGIPFQEINVSQQPDKKEELIKVSGGAQVPVIVDGDKVTIGFNGGG
ncbi:MAG: glutaredoxin family protein [Syntrophomonadaceae bacterium]